MKKTLVSTAALSLLILNGAGSAVLHAVPSAPSKAASKQNSGNESNIRRDDYSVGGENGGVSSVSAEEARSKLQLVRENSKKGTGITTIFNTLNNHDTENTDGQRQNVEDLKNATIPSREVSNVKCIMDSKWVADGTGADYNKSAKTLVDKDNKPVLDIMVDAVRSAPNKNGIVRTFYVTHSNERRELFVASSNYIMNGENTSGKKFLCYVEVRH